MGYTTDFYGLGFRVTPTLTPEHRAYLEAFNQTRRMKRLASETEKLPDPIRVAVGLPVGPEGDYFVGAPGPFGQGRTPDIVNHNNPPIEQPGLWCQWTPNKEGTHIVWDGGEKFYDYVEWLQYIIEHFLAPWGYTLNGSLEWVGEDRSDMGIIEVANNIVTAKVARIVYE